MTLVEHLQNVLRPYCADGMALIAAKNAIQCVADYYDNMASEAEAQDYNHFPYQDIANAMKEHIKE